jgi:hypothetical protein
MNVALTAILGLLLIALIGAAIGGGVGALVAKDRGLVIGAILGAIAVPVGYLAFWAIVISSTGIFGSGG